MCYDSSANVRRRGVPRRAPSTLVVGLGNPILGDDAIGWRVAEAVAAAAPDLEVDCLAVGGLSLMERMVGYDRAIIIDAAQTPNGKSGEVHCLSLKALPNLSSGHTTAAHDTSLQTALQLGKAMGADLPEDVTIVAIEAERVFTFSEDLTPAVAGAIPQAVEVVMALIDGATGTEEPGD